MSWCDDASGADMNRNRTDSRPSGVVHSHLAWYLAATCQEAPGPMEDHLTLTHRLPLHRGWIAVAVTLVTRQHVLRDLPQDDVSAALGGYSAR